jgi:3-phenylpropionate/trans-cinnamate dioxygenase ferredoxin subunit
MASIKIRGTKNGPYEISGDMGLVELVDANGKVYPVKGTIHLCRCGGSHTKPFCDGTHEKIHFQSE